MSVIYKYDLELGQTILSLPTKNKILKVGLQKKKLKLWVLVDTESASFKRYIFEVIGTGWAADFEKETYIDTVFIDEYVWHIFYQEV